MSTNDYVLEHSTDSIWRENDYTKVLSDELNTMDSVIAGKADSDHNHDSDYAALNHTHTEYAATTHNHDELYAAKTHETNSTVHVTSTEKNTWNSKAAGDHNHDSVYADIDHVHTGFASADHTHNTATTTTAGFLSATDKAKLDGIAAGATAYVHPTTHPASMITGLPTIPTSLPANGGNADTVDNCHASDFATATHDHDSDYAALNHNHNGTYATASHTHSDYATTGHTHSTATTTTAGFMSGTDKTKLNGIAENANNYSHPSSHPASMITETDSLKMMTAAERTKLSGIAENANLYVHPSTHPASMITGLPTSLPANGGNSDTVDGKHASDFSEASHTHNQLYISKTLQATNDSGGVEYSYGENSGQNVLNEISGMSKGFHTIYAIYGTAGNPDTTESYRYFIYKSSDTIGWVQAFGSSGSVYTNYLNGDTGWLGWKTIFDATPQALWNGENNGTGGYIMNASHTVTPSKPLSQCRNGWVLLWADFDPDTHTFNDYDFCTTVIPKKKPNNANWAGQPFICPIASYLKNSSPYDSETIRVKTLHVHDTKLVGHAANSADNRNDIVLRAVLEY
jgi:hypothetical protein